MLLTCPGCATTYRLDPPPGRPTGFPVQCTRCGRVFPATASTPDVPPAAPEPAPLPDAAEAGPTPGLDDRLREVWRHAALDPLDPDRQGVLADLLMERGDPLGEFYALFTQPGYTDNLLAKSRLNLLLRDAQPRLMPPGARAPQFLAGHLDHLEWCGPTDPDHPAWASVRSVHCALPSVPPRTIFGLPRLRRVTGLPRPLLARLLEARPPLLEDLECDFPRPQLPLVPEHLAPLAGLRRLGLRTTHLNRDYELGARDLVTVLGWAGRLERLRLSLPDLPMRELRHLGAMHAPGLVLEYETFIADEHGQRHRVLIDPLRAIIRGPLKHVRFSGQLEPIIQAFREVAGARIQRLPLPSFEPLPPPGTKP